MNDRELLELAAKAAELDFRMEYDEGWDPLANDGDAFRLAVKLQIDLEWLVKSGRVAAYGSVNGHDVYCCPTAVESSREDRNANARLAIVRVAAEIGSKYD